MSALYGKRKTLLPHPTTKWSRIPEPSYCARFLPPSPTLARRLHFGLNPSAAPRSAKVPRKCRLSFPPGVCGVCCCEGSQLEAKPCCKHRVSKCELRSCQPCSSQVAKQQFICNSCETGYSDIHILLIKQTSERKGISSIKYGNSYVGNRSGR